MNASDATTRYVQLQRALGEYRRDARDNAARRFEQCADVVRALGTRLRSDLGLAPDDEYGVFFCNTHTSDPDPEPDTEEHALSMPHGTGYVRMDVTIRDPEKRGDHGLVFFLEIDRLGDTRYRVAFDAHSPVGREVEVDVAAPETLGRFSDAVVDAILAWYATGDSRVRVRERAIGFGRDR